MTTPRTRPSIAGRLVEIHAQLDALQLELRVASEAEAARDPECQAWSSVEDAAEAVSGAIQVLAVVENFLQRARLRGWERGGE